MKRKPLRKTPGQSLVEFALAFPVLVLLIFMIFDLGRAVYYLSALHNGAREGARYGIVEPNDTTNIENHVISYTIGLGIEPTNIDIEVGESDEVDENTTYQVSVTVNYCFTPATPLVEIFLPINEDCNDEQQLLLVGEAVMRTEVKP